MQVAAASLSAAAAAAFAGSLLAVEVDSPAVRQNQQAAAAAVGKMLAVVEGSVEVVQSFV